MVKISLKAGKAEMTQEKVVSIQQKKKLGHAQEINQEEPDHGASGFPVVGKKELAVTLKLKSVIQYSHGSLPGIITLWKGENGRSCTKPLEAAVL